MTLSILPHTANRDAAHLPWPVADESRARRRSVTAAASVSSWGHRHNHDEHAHRQDCTNRGRSGRSNLDPRQDPRDHHSGPTLSSWTTTTSGFAIVPWKR